MVALFGRRQHERPIVSIEYLLILLFLLCECESACFVLFDSIFDGVFFSRFTRLLLRSKFVCSIEYRAVLFRIAFFLAYLTTQMFHSFCFEFQKGFIAIIDIFFHFYPLSHSLFPLTLYLCSVLKLSAGFKFGDCFLFCFVSLFSLNWLCLYVIFWYVMHNMSH